MFLFDSPQILSQTSKARLFEETQFHAYSFLISPSIFRYSRFWLEKASKTIRSLVLEMQKKYDWKSDEKTRLLLKRNSSYGSLHVRLELHRRSQTKRSPPSGKSPNSTV